MTEELKVIISAETSKVKPAMKEVNKALNDINEVSKKASSSIDSLTGKYSKQGKELGDLKKQYIDVAAAQGENSDEAQALAKQIEKLSGEYLNNGKRMEELADKADSFDKVSQAIKKVVEEQEKAAKAQKQFSDSMKKVGDAAKTGMKVGAALVGLVAVTEGFREGQAKLATAFGEAGASAETAKNTYNDLYRVMGDDGAAVEAANHLAQLTTNQKDLNEWTTICQGVVATFGSSLPIESLTEAANETAKTGSLTGALADALNWAGVNEEAFQEKLDACNTEAEREALIRGTLNGIYADAATQYEENNKDVLAQREAQAELNQAMADLSVLLVPLIVDLTTFASDVLVKVKDAIIGANEKLGEMKQWYEDNKTVIDNVAIVVGIFAAALGIAALAMNAATIATTVWTTVSTIATAVTSAFGAAMAFLTSPITLVVLAIAAVIAIAVLLYQNWDTVKEKLSKAIDKIKSAFDKLKEKIDDKIDKVKEKFQDMKDKFEEVKDKVKGIVDKIKGFFNFKVSLPKIKLPHFSIKPKGWSVGDLLKGSIPKLGIEWYAKGGVFDKPTAFGMNGNNVMVGGEAGAEAIVPLEKNTEWLDKIADRLAAKQGATPIVLNVDGKTFAQTSVNSINQLTKQTGSLGLKLF